MLVPFLNLHPQELQFVGEGNDHLVFSLVGTGSVLRIKKTPIKNFTTTKAEFLLHLEKDFNFIRYSRYLVSPLLVNKAYLVAVNSAVVDAVMKSISKNREGKRLDKQSNPFGLGVLFVNATISFSVRRISDASYGQRKCNLDLSSPLNHVLKARCPKSGTFSCGRGNSNEIIGKNNPNGNTRGNSEIRSSIDEPPRRSKLPRLIRNNFENVWSSKLGEEGSPEHPCKDADDANLLSAPLGERIFAFTKDESLAFRCNGVPSNNLVKSDTSPKTICIELKPKQGYKELTPSQNMICRFCLKQFIKIKKGSEKSRSLYCPLDLFSGERKRMKKALDDLFSTPQNNLRIFVEGAPAKDLSKYKYLDELIIDILLYELFKPKQNFLSSNASKIKEDSCFKETLVYSSTTEDDPAAEGFRNCINDLSGVYTDEISPKDSHTRIYQRIFSERSKSSLLSPSAILGRILLLQSLTKIYEHEAAALMRKLIAETGDAGQLDEIITDMSTFARKAEGASNAPHHKDQREKYKSHCHKGRDGFFIDLLNGGVGKESSDHVSSELTPPEGSFSDGSRHFSEAVQSLQESLVALSVKDVSLMISIQGPFDVCPKSSAESPFWLEFQEKWFKCQVTVVDLALKCPSKILEHEGSILQMEEILKKLPIKPSCCSG